MRDMIRPGLILLLITVVAGLSLGAVHSITKEAIETQQIQTKNEAMRKIMPRADEFEEAGLDAGLDVSSVYTAVAGGETAGYIIGVSAKGYGGDIEVLVAIGSDGVITGVDIVSHSETPGLGANAKSPAFLNQFSGRSEKLNVVKVAPGANDVQAIASATITSNAVTSCVNAALDYFNANLKGAY